MDKAKKIFLNSCFRYIVNVRIHKEHDKDYYKNIRLKIKRLQKNKQNICFVCNKNISEKQIYRLPISKKYPKGVLRHNDCYVGSDIWLKNQSDSPIFQYYTQPDFLTFDEIVKRLKIFCIKLDIMYDGTISVYAYKNWIQYLIKYDKKLYDAISFNDSTIKNHNPLMLGNLPDTFNGLRITKNMLKWLSECQIINTTITPIEKISSIQNITQIKGLR